MLAYQMAADKLELHGFEYNPAHIDIKITDEFYKFFIGDFKLVLWRNNSRRYYLQNLQTLKVISKTIANEVWSDMLSKYEKLELLQNRI